MTPNEILAVCIAVFLATIFIDCLTSSEPNAYMAIVILTICLQIQSRKK